MSSEYQANGAAYLKSLLSTARAEGKNEIRISGDYEIEETVRLPSDMTVILENCRLKLKSGVMCPMFGNEHGAPGELHDGASPDRNIRIVGVGRAILDGGTYNGLCEANSQKNGMPHISQNNMILFCNVEDFAIENIEIRRQRWWAINLLYCRFGQLRHIRFEADYTRRDADGHVIVGLDWKHYAETCIKNADGIDLRSGCHDILIDDISGFTEDDSVALTGLFGSTEKLFCATGLSNDIYNVIIRNIRTASFCSQVRLLNQGGVKLYNVLIDGVMDASMGCPYYTGRGVSGVRIGDEHLYGSRHSTPDETRNIRVQNVYSRARVALQLAGAMSDMTYEAICGFDGCPTLIEDHRVNRSTGID